MALGTLADNPDCGLKIVPCGMNYFHAHKFRSRAVIEFGNPIEVPKELVDQFREGERRESVGALLDIIYQSLVAVTVTSPDYETLMVSFNCLFSHFFTVVLCLKSITGHSSCSPFIQHQRQEASSSYGGRAEPSSRDWICSFQR